MSRFSQRIGARPAYTSGLEEASELLRIAAWNATLPRLLPDSAQDWTAYQANAKALWAHINWRADEIPIYAVDARKLLKPFWFGSPWEDFFDAYEFVVQLLTPDRRLAGAAGKWIGEMNHLLAVQGCAYRFIAGELAPVTNTTEVKEVVAATECAIGPAAKHIRDALGLLPPNPNAMPRNSAKESISAVESALKHLTGEPAATLGEGLKAFERRYGPLHPAIRRLLDQFYTYTNGPDGIRHGLVEGAADVTVNDARFVVVNCSAFVNYLIALSTAAPPAQRPALRS